MNIFSFVVRFSLASYILSLMLVQSAEAQNAWNGSAVSTVTTNGIISAGAPYPGGTRFQITGGNVAGPLAGFNGVFADIDLGGMGANSRLELRGHDNPYIDFATVNGPDYNSRIWLDMALNSLRVSGTDLRVDQRLYVTGNTMVLQGDGNLYGGASSPEFLFTQSNSPDYWAILKRSSTWGPESDHLVFSYKDVNGPQEIWNPSIELHTNGNAEFHRNVGMGAKPRGDARLYVNGNTMILEGDGTLYGGASSPELLIKENYRPDYWALLKRAASFGAAGNRLHFSFKDYNGNWNPSLEFLTNGYSQFFGHVGIGVEPDANNFLRVAGKTLVGANPPTNSPYSNYMLAVDGLMVAKEIRVATTAAGWPDYVFSSDYKLMPLEEVESSIHKNKHLPGVPSAQDVENQGVNIGEMQAKLLQKVEELTLYLIDQKKDIEELKQQNERLKQQLQASSTPR